MTVHELPIDPKKVWRKFRTVPAFIQQVVRGRKCKARCNGCGANWAQTSSEHVHALTRTDKSETVHICDDCLAQLCPHE